MSNYLPDTVLAHRYHLCLVHMMSHLLLCPWADNRLCFLPRGKTVYSDPSLELRTVRKQFVNNISFQQHEWKRCSGHYLLPLYFGTQRTFGGRPLILKCFPSKSAHCSSRKSLFCLVHGSVLQDLNFIRRPTQYLPPFLGLEIQTNNVSGYSVIWLFNVSTCPHLWPWKMLTEDLYMYKSHYRTHI